MQKPLDWSETKAFLDSVHWKYKEVSNNHLSLGINGYFGPPCRDQSRGRFPSILQPQHEGHHVGNPQVYKKAVYNFFIPRLERLVFFSSLNFKPWLPGSIPTVNIFIQTGVYWSNIWTNYDTMVIFVQYFPNILHLLWLEPIFSSSFTSSLINLSLKSPKF